MVDFKIIYPAGYQIANIYNDNIDVNIVLSDGSVYFGTFFTLASIQDLIIQNEYSYFWCTNLVIVENLSENAIYKAVLNIMNDGYFENIFENISKRKTIT
jgi:hypothetical protein